MKDWGVYFDEGTTVFNRRGDHPVVITEIARCGSHRLAKLIANCLNLYRRSPRFAASVDAAEKGEQTNGNRNGGTTESSNQPQPANSR